jgi:ketopantoate reductase
MARFLVLGAGQVGQDYAGHLRRAGHAVSLYARPAHAAQVRARGIRIQELDNRVRYLPVERPDEVATELPDLAGVDYVVVAFRSEQREAAVELLAPRATGHAELVIGFPMWARTRLGIEDRFRASHYLVPRIYAGRGRRDRSVTKLGPLVPGADPAPSRALAALLDGALPTRCVPDLRTRFQSVLALGLPLLLGLGRTGFAIAPLLGDPAARRELARAQREHVALMRAGGEPVRRPARALVALPLALHAALLAVVGRVVGRFDPERIRLHFGGVAGQTRRLIDEQLALAADLAHATPRLRALAAAAPGAATVPSLALLP